MTIRPAVIDDAHHLARLLDMADGGCHAALYDGLFPGQSLEDTLAPKFSQPGAADFYENHWIAERDGRIAGGMHAFPFDIWANDTLDPRIPEEHLAIIEPFANLVAPGTYYVNVLSVYPAFCRRGIASSFLSLAREHAKAAAFTELSLTVFAENAGAVALYEKSGFKVVRREPVVEHSLVRYTGEVFLMIAAL